MNKALKYTTYVLDYIGRHQIVANKINRKTLKRLIEIHKQLLNANRINTIKLSIELDKIGEEIQDVVNRINSNIRKAS